MKTFSSMIYKSVFSVEALICLQVGLDYTLNSSYGKSWNVCCSVIRGFNFKIKTRQEKLCLSFSFQCAQITFFVLIPLTTIPSQIMTSCIYAYYDVSSLVFCTQYTFFFLFSVHASVPFYNVDYHSEFRDFSREWEKGSSAQI